MTDTTLPVKHPSSNFGADTHNDTESTMLSNSVPLETGPPEESNWNMKDLWAHITDQSMRASAMLLVFALILGLVVGFILNQIF